MAGSNVSNLFQLLDDGRWHSINDLAEKLGCKVEEVARAILSVSSLINFEDESQRVRLKPWVMKLPLGEETKEAARS